jgi:hypothetical protein
MFNTNSDTIDGKQIKFTIDHIREGLKLTTFLSSILNDDNNDNVDKFFENLWKDKEYYHIDYLKSKLSNSISHHAGKISGALFISYKNIPEVDRMRLIKYLINIINDSVNMGPLEITLWFIKWSYSNLGIFWMRDVLGLLDNELENEWQIYKKTNFDNYFSNLTDDKLQSYVDAINKMRKEYPSIDEMNNLRYCYPALHI